MSNKKVCCICNKEFEEFPNNPAPFGLDPDDMACTSCNFRYVLPIREAISKLGCHGTYEARLLIGGGQAEVYKDGELFRIYDYDLDIFID